MDRVALQWTLLYKPRLDSWVVTCTWKMWYSLPLAKKIGTAAVVFRRHS
jgi:hypothetical protein